MNQNDIMYRLMIQRGEMDRSLDDSDRKKKRLQETEKELKLACEKAEERKYILNL